MSDKPRHRFCSQDLLGDLQEALSLPFHIQGFVPTASGGYKAFGLAASLWEKAGTRVVAPFVADAAPTDVTVGLDMLEFPQARFHLAFTGGLGVETANVTVWHRSHNIDDVGTVGHWTMGQSYVAVKHLEEVLDPSLYHGEIYFQVTAVAPGATTSMTIFVQGTQDMTTGANVSVVIPPVAVDISAWAVPPDSVLAVTTEDGLPAGTKHVIRGDNQGNLIVSPDNAYDCIPVDLGVARAAPGVEILSGGLSVAGRDIAVVSTDGNFDLKFNAAANPAIPQTPTDHGAWDNTVFTKIYMVNILQVGKTAYLYVGKRV